MTAPAAALTVTDRYRLKELELEERLVVTAGRVMWCRGSKVLGFSDVGDLANVMTIPRGADTLCVSPADYGDVKRWIG